MDRNYLIDRKYQVIAEIGRARSQLESLRERSDRRSQRQARKLEEKLERLMAEEYRLRIEIDRSGRGTD